MYVRICKHCGKRYMARSYNSQYCSKKCKIEAKAKRMAKTNRARKEDQLCWDCKRTDCTCSWMRYSIPVEGWTVKETIIINGEERTNSYKIIKCPEFIRG